MNLHALLTTLFLLLMLSGSHSQQAYFISQAEMCPEGKNIVFVYEGDLWRVPRTGGIAYRIISMEGKIRAPRYSPDGKWIAFSSNRDGNYNIYVTPADGGQTRQLTFHQSSNITESWSWDSHTLYFSSDRYNLNAVYTLPLPGGPPQRLFDHYFNIEHDLMEHPLKDAYLFTESWESLRFPQRKRYRGEHRPDILLYNAQTNELNMLTDHEGKDLWPTVDKNGNIFFASDMDTYQYNLFTFVDGEKKALTHWEETSIRQPRVNASGQWVVFEKDYQLHVYDVETQQVTTPEIHLFQRPAEGMIQGFAIEGNITDFDISPDGKKIAMVARGELFVSDLQGKFVRQMPTLPTERVIEARWLYDNETLAYTATRQGWAGLFTLHAARPEEERLVEVLPQTARLPAMNPERDQMVYLSGRNEVKLADMRNFTTRTLVEDELWGFQNSAPSFSPDGSHVLFTAYRHFEQDVLIHNIRQNETINITQSGVSQRQPHWSPCGRYIWFSSDRLRPHYPRGNTENKLWRIPLYRFSPPKRNEQFTKLFSEEDEKEAKPEIIIDTERIHERWEQIDVRGGKQFNPMVFSHNDGQVVFFLSDHDRGRQALWSRTLKDFEEDKTTKIEGPSPGQGMRIVPASNDFYVLAGGNIQKIDLSGGKMDRINISHSFNRNMKYEFRQVFHETWAALEENFYNEDFHGLDWHAVKDIYSKRLPYVSTRQNLRTLINDMLGELNASHLGFSSQGEEEKTFLNHQSAETGLIFQKEHPFTVERVIRNSNADLTRQVILPGDKLMRVNGRTCEASGGRDACFYFPKRPQELELTFLRNNEEVTVLLQPHTPAQIDAMLYDEWIAANRDYVHQQSDNRIAYVYMKNMSQQALDQFLTDMTSYAHNKEALLLDIRFNRGGNVHDEVLQFLSQRPYLQWKYRGGEMAPQPNFAPSAGPITLLINERSLSDAEMTAEGFRQLELGTILGVETYRWIIFTSGKSFVDGSFTRMPSWGCFTLEGENLELTGVAPDIEVRENFSDRLHNRQPQLDKAIEYLLERLGE